MSNSKISSKITMPEFFTQKTNHPNYTTASISDAQAAYDAALAAQKSVTESYEEALADIKSNINDLNNAYDNYEELSIGHSEKRRKSTELLIDSYKAANKFFKVDPSLLIFDIDRVFKLEEFRPELLNDPDFNRIHTEMKGLEKETLSLRGKMFDVDTKITSFFEKEKGLKDSLGKYQAALEKTKTDLATATKNLPLKAAYDVALAAYNEALDHQKLAKKTYEEARERIHSADSRISELRDNDPDPNSNNLTPHYFNHLDIIEKHTNARFDGLGHLITLKQANQKLSFAIDNLHLAEIALDPRSEKKSNTILENKKSQLDIDLPNNQEIQKISRHFKKAAEFKYETYIIIESSQDEDIMEKVKIETMREICVVQNKLGFCQQHYIPKKYPNFAKQSISEREKIIDNNKFTAKISGTYYEVVEKDKAINLLQGKLISNGSMDIKNKKIKTTQKQKFDTKEAKTRLDRSITFLESIEYIINNTDSYIGQSIAATADSTKDATTKNKPNELQKDASSPGSDISYATAFALRNSAELTYTAAVQNYKKIKSQYDNAEKVQIDANTEYDKCSKKLHCAQEENNGIIEKIDEQLKKLQGNNFVNISEKIKSCPILEELCNHLINLEKDKIDPLTKEILELDECRENKLKESTESKKSLEESTAALAEAKAYFEAAKATHLSVFEETTKIGKIDFHQEKNKTQEENEH